MSLERTTGVCYPTRERDRIEIRNAQRELAAEEQKRSEEAMAPVLAAQADLRKSTLALRDLEREAVLSGKPDPGFVLPESVSGKRMTRDEAEQFNRVEAQRFVSTTPDYFPCQQNLQTMTDYLLKQEVQIADTETYRRAYERLKFLGLLVERPDEARSNVEPQPETIVEQTDPEAERKQRYDKYMTEIVVTDPRTGEGLTEYQLDRVPADEYARLMRVPRFAGILEPTRPH